MQSKVIGRNYLILPDGERIPIKINKNRTDKILSRMQNGLQTFNECVQELYQSNDYELYNFLTKEAFDSACLNFYDGKCWNLTYLEQELEKIGEELLSNDDNIKTAEEAVILEDLGYRDAMWGRTDNWWEKVLEDTEEREVVEEIRGGEEAVRRLRTTIWEKTDYGRHSKKILYKTLPIGKKLSRALENSRLAKAQNIKWED